jgi:hypothetical protein
MRQLVYMLRFTGRATPASPDRSVLTVTATAAGMTLTTTVGPDGLAGDLRATAGGEAEFAAELTITGATSFQEIGTITFGDGHLLRLSTVGSGYLGASPDAALKHGTVSWRVEGGEGQFAGASGLITSNLFVGEDLAITDHHLGVLFLP